MNNGTGGGPSDRRPPITPEEILKQKRRLVRNAVIRLLIFAGLAYKVIGEAGPWTALCFALLFLAFELYERQARRQIEVGSDLRAIADTLKRRLFH